MDNSKKLIPPKTRWLSVLAGVVHGRMGDLKLLHYQKAHPNMGEDPQKLRPGAHCTPSAIATLSPAAVLCFYTLEGGGLRLS